MSGVLRTMNIAPDRKQDSKQINY